MNDQKRRWKNAWKPALAVAGFAAMMIYASGFLYDKVAPDSLPVPPGEPLPAHAEIFEVQASPRTPRIEIMGTTASDRRIALSSRLSAYVQEVLVNAGDHVKAGQTLVTLDDREIREQLAAGEAQLDQASSEYRRAQQLFERQATTEQALTAAAAAFNTAKAHVERIKIMLTYAQVVSPMDGIVTERRVEAGDLASPSQILLELFDPSSMRLEVPVPFRLIGKFSLGDQRKAMLEYPAKTYDAVVTEIVGEIDPMTRTRRVKLRLENTGGEVLPGTFGRIWVEEEARPALFIPANAVVRVGQLEMIYLVQDQRMIRRLIKTGRTENDEVEVLSGLTPGDRIILPASIRES